MNVQKQLGDKLSIEMKIDLPEEVENFFWTATPFRPREILGLACGANFRWWRGKFLIHRGHFEINATVVAQMA